MADYKKKVHGGLFPENTKRNKKKTEQTNVELSPYELEQEKLLRNKSTQISPTV